MLQTHITCDLPPIYKMKSQFSSVHHRTDLKTEPKALCSVHLLQTTVQKRVFRGTGNKDFFLCAKMICKINAFVLVPKSMLLQWCACTNDLLFYGTDSDLFCTKQKLVCWLLVQQILDHFYCTCERSPPLSVPHLWAWGSL